MLGFRYWRTSQVLKQIIMLIMLWFVAEIRLVTTYCVNRDIKTTNDLCDKRVAKKFDRPNQQNNPKKRMGAN